MRGLRYSLNLFPQLFPCYADMGVGYDKSATPQHPPTGPTEVHHGGYEDSRYTFTQARLTLVAALPLFRDTY